MKNPPGRRSFGYLIVLILLCLGYAAVLHFHFLLTGIHQMDGIIGVLLGLYSAAQPAANILDLVLFGQYDSVRASFRKVGAPYWGLNLFVLFAGWVVISISMLRYSALT